MSLNDDYRAIREGAAIGAVQLRAPLAVAGKDRATYLQGLLTNDIEALAPGTGCYAAWLSPQGRMLTDMHVLESDGLMLLDVPEQLVAQTAERLDQFIFSEDVKVESLAAALEAVWMHGPEAAATLTAVLGGVALAGWRDYRHGQFEFQGSPVSVARIDQVGVPGYCIFVEPARAPLLRDALAAAGAKPVGREAITAARIEAGYPVFGADMTETTIPLEAGIEERAISFTKGCYVGQEVIIRVLHRGGGRVARRLVRLRLELDDDSAVPAAGAKLHAAERAIGEVTSAARSPRLGAIALGYAHRDFTSAGTTVEVDTGTGRIIGTVTGPATAGHPVGQ